MVEEESDEVLQNIAIQLQEIEMLQAMFPSEGELEWHDPSLLVDAEEFVKSNGKASVNMRYLSFNVNLKVLVESGDKEEQCKLGISISLPSGYPNVHPNVSVASNSMSRKSQSSFNKCLLEHIIKLPTEEIMILEVINWIQENSSKFFDLSKESTPEKKKLKTIEKIYHMWLFMHHIYNKEKRKNIINWANELELTGFSLPGKPGVVYVEGLLQNVEEYFERLRRLTWKRMSCKVKEQLENNTRIFNDFQELCFDVHGGRDYHMDMGKFYLFLKEKGLGYMFQELFGVAGQEAQK